jgi:Tfp pilus assembly PilM family ATPase
VLTMRSKSSAITFDVGAAGIRACQLRRRNGRLQLCDRLGHELAAPAESVEPSLPALDNAQLERLIARGNFQGRDIALVLSPPEAQFYPMRLPPALLAQPRERIEQALKCEVAQESRQSAELEVRFWPLPAGRSQQPNVMAAVTPGETAAQWCELAERCRLHLRRIDVSPCALVALARRTAAPAVGEIWGVLDLGLRHSVLTVVIGAVPAYVRALSVSTYDWTCQLAQAFEVDHAVAEQLKREHGVGTPASALLSPAAQPGGRPHGAARDATAAGTLLNAADLPTAVSTVLRHSLRTLAHEVGRCFSYVLQSYPDLALSRLFLAGGGAASRGLAATLQAALDVPVKVIASDPACTGAAADEPGSDAAASAPPAFAAAIGGALLDLENS